MKRGILILGGGMMQTPAIAAARRRGLEVHVADGNSQCIGRREADIFHHVDLRDRDGLASAARGIANLAGVFTAGTDFSANTAWVAESLNLPGIPYEVAVQATDKGIMRSVLKAAGVAIPRHMTIVGNDAASLDAIQSSLSFPVVCKPVDNMGARGVKLVSDVSELSVAVEAARQLSRSQRVIVEEQIVGQEYSLDAIVEGENITITGIAERHIYFSPWFVELGHTIPVALTQSEQAALETVFRDAIRALGITRGVGAAKGDIFLTDGSDGRANGAPAAVVGEVAARLSGGYMSGWTFPLATGIDLTDVALGLALGESPDSESLMPQKHLFSAERAIISAPGIVEAIATPTNFYNHVSAFFIHARPGERIAPPTNNVEKAANVIMVDSDRQNVESRVIDAIDHVLVQLRTGDSETDGWLFGEAWQGRYARYRGNQETMDAIAGMPAILGSRSELTALYETTKSLPVRALSEESLTSLVACYPAQAATVVLRRLVDSDLIRFCDVAPAIAGSFWRAFLAAGEQGADYVIRSFGVWSTVE